ncbi:methylated-DNA--[protein]-cysteine S-methyltransferase [Bacillus licheniformis]|jgi:methylated-DNA-[protein]-cysteine S-methyltransferase|uniref:methylated-DNA--[protein]-cysteine S-methyltransferase n=5 Tax=Bacillales TaxID=1385 RepID=Q65GV7_BACLD|nr:MULTISPECIES: methylated-DNA--[protein]-cysteine S-methyltransferase [Bacillus]MBY8347349.1 methylated-DNA--[protein]-cysteine S-methyltransferase [Bacillus sp. PCH94]MDP4082116.1 methylated-DNA--[protein]-cysteine S-methyltransferase [Bacillota bacterium]AAU24341.1 O6-methylguanine-DNA methyltransferase [Bacillus licheniformis DSM 13 = ATCC 14580]AAU41707.1 methylated-DNA--protein-cysteine methyltransferase AdaB [Bacillus licheniformis DSM 13 = ATCC 14580]AKQ74101.1 O6-methylguanine-DNA me
MDDQIVYWRTLICRGWQIHIGATARGLCFTGGWNQGFEDLAAWAEKRFTQPVFIRDDKGLAEYAEQLQAYLNGKRTHFSFPVDLAGTPFQLAVWKALSEIPYGSTCSYSDIAEHIEKQAAVRAVGAAIGANPLLMVVPCHRVIGKSGQLTGYRGGLDMKKELMMMESGGVTAQFN